MKISLVSGENYLSSFICLVFTWLSWLSGLYDYRWWIWITNIFERELFWTVMNDGAQKPFTDANRHLTFLSLDKGNRVRPAYQWLTWCQPGCIQVPLELKTVGIHSYFRLLPLVTMDTLASSEYNLPQAVALVLWDSASIFGAAAQGWVKQQEWMIAAGWSRWCIFWETAFFLYSLV